MLCARNKLSAEDREVNRRIPALEEPTVSGRRAAVKSRQYGATEAAVSARCRRELPEAPRRSPQSLWWQGRLPSGGDILCG